MPIESMIAIELKPDDIGCPPVLEPGEYCETAGLYHFCTPDKGFFATVDVWRDPGSRRVTITKNREFCGKHVGAVGNKWTVRQGWWEPVGGER